MNVKTKKKPDLKKVVKWYFPIWFLIVMLVIIGQFFPPIIYIPFVLGTLVAVLIWFDRVWRCPDCGKSLGKMVIAGDITCRHCGKKHKLM